MEISRRRAVQSGIVATVAVVGVQAFNSFACYGHDLTTFVKVVVSFLLVPLLPAFISLLTANPLRAVGACLLFVPWPLFAYTVDCVRPYAGGGASMVYVSVLLWGTPCAVLGALITGPVTRMLGIVIKR